VYGGLDVQHTIRLRHFDKGRNLLLEAGWRHRIEVRMDWIGRLPVGVRVVNAHATRVSIGMVPPTTARLLLQMDFFVYSRDQVDAADLRDDQELLEEHWSYMDGFAESMIARGPTLDTDREAATGSLHVLALPSVDAAREFVALEPNNRAGVYGEHLVWRFENLLGRSMWEFSGQPGEPRFLIIGRSHLGRPVSAESLPAELLERLILYGALTTLDDAEPVGVALALQAPDREAVDALIEDEGTGLGGFSEVDVYNWEFGGRR
jgi:uncharacterized protein